MELLYNKWFDSNAVDNISVILSISSILLGILVLVQTYAIKKHYVKSVRISEMNKDLDELAKEIVKLLKFTDNSNSLLKCFARVSALMKKLKKTAISEDKEEINKYLKIYSDINASKSDDCWGAYRSICVIIEMIQQSNKEKIIL